MQRVSLRPRISLSLVVAVGFAMFTCSASAEWTGPGADPGHLYLMEGDGMMLRRQNVTLETLGAELKKRHVQRTDLVVHIAEDASPKFVRRVYRRLHELGFTSIETRLIGYWFVDRLFPK